MGQSFFDNSNMLFYAIQDVDSLITRFRNVGPDRYHLFNILTGLLGKEAFRVDKYFERFISFLEGRIVCVLGKSALTQVFHGRGVNREDSGHRVVLDVEVVLVCVLDDRPLLSLLVCFELYVLKLLMCQIKREVTRVALIQSDPPGLLVSHKQNRLKVAKAGYLNSLFNQVPAAFALDVCELGLVLDRL